jgi:hypothetical protein
LERKARSYRIDIREDAEQENRERRSLCLAQIRIALSPSGLRVIANES